MPLSKPTPEHAVDLFKKLNCGFGFCQILQALSDQKLLFESCGDGHDVDEELEYHKVFILLPLTRTVFLYI